MHLKQAVIAKEFDVSQAPVREALHALVLRGFLESGRNQGVRVKKFESTELLEILDLRLALEEAAARRGIPCTRSDLRELGDCLHRIKTTQVTSFGGDVDDFHRQIIQMSRNQMFLQTWERIPGSAVFGVETFREFSLRKAYLRILKGIVSAYREADATRASELLREAYAQLQRRFVQIAPSTHPDAYPADRRGG